MANYIYNGVGPLPDIDAVWTNKEKFPKAAIELRTTGFYALILSAAEVETSEGLSADYYAPCVQYRYKVGTDNEWTFLEELTDGKYHSLYSKVKWANYDIYYGDGSGLFLAASEPVPVTDTDHNALVQGWIVGKRLAAQRGRA
jgi:hypothetical protein